MLLGMLGGLIARAGVLWGTCGLCCSEGLWAFQGVFWSFPACLGVCWGGGGCACVNSLAILLLGWRGGASWLLEKTEICASFGG